jgi:hypothetical protein
LQSPYTLAIDAARDTLVQRARQYKRLVITVSLGGLAAVAAALALGRLGPLLVLALLPCGVLAFFALDLRAVHRWRSTTLAAWVSGGLQLDLLAGTLRQVPGLPAPTVEGMLDSLPAWTGNGVPLPARAALSEAQQALARIAQQALAVRSVAWGLVAAVGAAAWVAHRPAWLGLWLAAPALGFAWRLACRQQVQRARAALMQAWSDAGVDAAAGAAWQAQLNWQGVPASLQARWQAA